jgi:hypothetical protein
MAHPQEIIKTLSVRLNVRPLSREDEVRQVFRKSYVALKGVSLDFKRLDWYSAFYHAHGELPDFVVAYYQSQLAPAA